MAENSAYVPSALAAIHDCGAHITIDNFGTVYRSLVYLGDIRLNVPDADHTLIMSIRVVQGGSRSIFNVISVVAHSVGTEIVGKAIEPDTQYASLVFNGCNIAPGYLS
ncbi:MAG: EAL domain-containing protein [Betaproteobacteria bacterium]|nr:MAG: EAL domain-containing protein [Betaproteobacteria bacterium]